MFIVECPKNEKYITRLNRELDLINQKNLVCYLIRAIEILNLTDFPSLKYLEKLYFYQNR